MSVIVTIISVLISIAALVPQPSRSHFWSHLLACYSVLYTFLSTGRVYSGTIIAAGVSSSWRELLPCSSPLAVVAYCTRRWEAYRGWLRLYWLNWVGEELCSCSSLIYNAKLMIHNSTLCLTSQAPTVLSDSCQPIYGYIVMCHGKYRRPIEQQDPHSLLDLSAVMARLVKL